MKFFFGDRAVSSGFRASVAGLLPGLGKKVSYWRFLQFLLFSDFRDKETDRIAIPHGLIAAIERRKADKHYSASRFLKAFRKDVLDFTVTEHTWAADTAENGHVRTIASLTLPSTLEALVRVERRRVTSADRDGRVCMATGSRWDWRARTALRQAELSEAAQRASMTEMCPETLQAFNYLNGLSSNRFTTALRHLPMAMKEAGACHDAERELNILSGIQDKPVPTYVPSDKTTRLYTLGPCLLHLHRSLRKIITQDWVTADLKSAQLAIVAKVWGVPTVNDFLGTGRSIWPDLCEHMGLTYTEENKTLVKTALYALIFGAGKTRLRDHFTKALGQGRKHCDLFLSHPVIAALFKARAVQLQQILHDGGAWDACGRFIPLQFTTKPGYETPYNNSRSVLACVAQSYEMRLLKPVFDMAVAQKGKARGYTIPSLLHDGITFDVHQSKDMQVWKDRIAKAVREQAQSLGITTEIEYS